MDSIGNIFKQRTALERKTNPRIRSERDELVQRFANKKCIRLHDRKTKELRLATASEIALILQRVPTKDLHPFFKQCEEARSFSRFFWWSIKPPKV